MMNLKAAAKGVGLDERSVGWAILEKLVEEGGDDCSADWCDVWAAVTTGKVSITLCALMTD
jgi:hypothetical protein